MATYLMSWTPQAAVLPTTLRPAMEYSNLSNFPTMRLLFDSAVDESCYFVGILPQHYAGGDTAVLLYWTASATGDVTWRVLQRGIGNNDSVDGAFTDAFSVVDSVTAADDLMVASMTFSFQQIPPPLMSKGDLCIIEVRRQGLNDSDTLAVDARLLGVELREV